MKRFGQHSFVEAGVHETDVLRVDLGQIGLANRQARQVQTTQIPTQQPQQINDVARPVALLLVGPPTPPVEQCHQ